MKKKALGKSLKEIEAKTQPTFPWFDVGTGSKSNGPETSHIAEEEMTENGTREKHCRRIIKAMHDLKATEKRPVTGAMIADAAGMSIVQVMRRLATDLETPGHIKRTDKKMLCGLTRTFRLGWFIKK